MSTQSQAHLYCSQLPVCIKAQITLDWPYEHSTACHNTLEQFWGLGYSH